MTERVIKVKLLVEAPGSAKVANETADGLEKVAKQTDKSAASAKGAKDQLISFGTVLKTAVVIGAGLAAKSMLDLGMSYEKSLNTLQAVSGASAQTMAEVSTAAKALGNDIAIPGASAGDAAAAMTELAKGGLTVEESMSAARGTLQLAAAAQIDGAQAATIQSAALNTFGLAASDAGRVADVLANAANASSGEITDFAQGMAQSGLAAQSMGISLEDTATTLALFANNGLSGSDAGTSFKTMLISLTNPSEQAAGALKDLGVNAFDANGQFVGMRAITEQLTAAQQRMTTEQFNQAAATAFGTDALRAAVAVASEGTEGFDAMSTAIGKQGGAADLAAANSKGLAGAVDLVKNAAETAALGLYEQLSPALDSATRGVAAMVPELADSLLPALTEAGTALIGLIDIVAPLVPLVGDALASAVSATAATITALAPVVEVTVTALAGVLTMVSNLPGPILAVATAFAVLTLTAPFGAVVTAIMSMVTAARVAGGAMLALKAATVGAFSNPVILAAVAVAAAIGFVVAASDKGATATALYTDAIDKQTGALKKNSSEILLQQTAQDGSLAKMRTIGVDAATYIGALQGQADKVAIVEQKLRDAADAAEELNDNRPDFSGGLGADTNLAVQTQRDFVLEAAAASDAWKASSEGLNVALADQKAIIGATQGEWSPEKADAYSRSIEAITKAREGMPKTPLPDPVSAATLPSLESMSAALDTVKDSASAAETRVAFLQLQLDTMAGRAPDVETAARAAQGAIRDYTAAYLGQGAAARDVTQAEIDRNDIMNKQVDDTYTAEQKALDLAAANDRVTLAQNGVAASGDTLFEAGQQVYQSFLQQSQAAYDTAVANGDLLGAQEAARATAQKLRDDFINANTTLYGSRDAAAAVADGLGLIPADTSAQISLNGATAAQLGAEAVKRALDNIPAVTTAQIKTINTTQFVTQGGVGATFADGGIRANGITQRFADGGITKAANGLAREAMMAPGGSNILWAEDETQGESYVPHANSKRSGADKIMAKTASIFGGAYLTAQELAGRQAGGYASPGGGYASAAPTLYAQVFVGDREITDIVRVQIAATPLATGKLRAAQRELELV